MNCMLDCKLLILSYNSLSVVETKSYGSGILLHILLIKKSSQEVVFVMMKRMRKIVLQ